MRQVSQVKTSDRSKVGGLDLSRRDLDRDLDLDLNLDVKKSQSRQSRFSRQVLKTGLDETKSRQSLDWSRRPKVSIFVEISIEISISTPKKVSLDKF